MSASEYSRRLGILTCRESARLLSDDLDRALSRTERMALRLHLALCRRCRRFARNLAALRDLLGRMTDQCLAGQGFTPTLTSQARARIRKQVVRAQSQQI